LIVQAIEDAIKAPIHKPVIESSIPSHLEKPTPAPTAIVQTGHTACTLLKTNKVKGEKILKFISSLIY
jgi:hypothetical protein